MYPHERSLVKRMEGKPFALVGVNSDSTREFARKAEEKEHLTWRSFWNGGSRYGPISKRWNVQAWPTLYLLDADGVIRAKWIEHVNANVLDEAIDHALTRTTP
jgi:hypothetical protein